ncbi:maleylacetate reductase [Halomonas urumqiensis]|uniref:Maleylacetate reductase n=1 Tax=Halomonas urumqiensis TaxID=1684789 RepID=A0A2N7ULF9_9GAMM|nr:maleylacetate reductase [Halomonas urumqiensis]PMR81256.1 maleylacetate reductase [Halomonas urumqiensis]PTB01733.1 maleylacetate reductase [Halomonas urumqiensis]GHE22174.1 maleylacetate reductase [Halomonas urumqiensis]
MQPFVYHGLPSRVVFGQGSLSRLTEELEHLGCRRALVLATPQQQQQARDVLEQLGERGIGLYTEAAMHTPVEVTERAMRVVEELSVDCTVAIGGGSTIGLGKAIALRTGLPQVAIPTTYAGSEMTPILGETRDGIKTTQRTLDVLPETVIYDVDLTLSLPAVMSGTSGINAIAHAVEALYARDGNPVIALMAEEGIRALAKSLPRIASDPANAEARSDALYGAWLCGTCLGSVGMSLHHKLCHTLGGSFDLPHAETHTIVLPHALAYNAPAVPEAMARIARALGCTDAAAGLYDLGRSVGAPSGLGEIGFQAADVDRATEIATQNPYWNPRDVEAKGIHRLLSDAQAGQRPQVGDGGEQ